MLTIIIPSFKGSKIIAKQLDEFILWLDKSIASYEIIIVDDGSKDNGETKKVAKQYSCRYLENENNLGKGGAVKNGVLNAKGYYIIYTDVASLLVSNPLRNFIST